MTPRSTRKSSLLRLASSALLSALVALTLLSGCGKKEEAPAAVVSVQAATVSTQAVTQHIEADAVLSPIAQAAIAAKITSPVKKFYVQRGSRVKAGQLLATLENADLKAAVTDNQGSLTAQDATYQTTVQAQVPEEYQRAELDLAQAKANLDLNQSIVDSRRKLFAEGAIAGRDLDTAQAALVQAQAAWDTAKQHLDGMKQVAHQAALKQAKGQLESAQGKYQAAEAQLSYSEIRSPIAGVVTDRPLYAGETAAAGAPLITVMDVSALLAKLHLPQSQVQKLKVGDTASVAVPGIDQPVPGKITMISPALDPGSTTVELWVRMENPHGDLRPGTAVKVSLSSSTIPNALVVPTIAILLTNARQKAVMVVDKDSVAHLTPVTVGVVDGDNTQILTGLSAGQRIVTQGAYGLDDGTQVNIVAAGQGSGDAQP
ncbi:MAG TPA: efflux RND transporter periplasmic adaptor subunit [Acidobacteriaceae bacterium]|jgi:multidrug efflux pump subunit AcrA (membrane-fusion protein)|nr:efflux RND transporter periplasmic adaptor subunit [Acidobacteriaceae bacterium]